MLLIPALPDAEDSEDHNLPLMYWYGIEPLVPADFLLPAKSSGGDQAQQDLAIANCLAQSEALMDGFNEKGLEPWRVHVGNRPSNTILFEKLDPETLGELIALYEHKVFVEGVIWGINSFDQWGVELGKELANKLLPLIEGKGDASGKDGSTKGLLGYLVG